MATPISFESSRVKKLQREQIRKDRQIILDKAKDDFERRERRKEKQKALGEGTWMLSAVNDRIESENKALEKIKSKKKKEKKKHKKDKKHKKKKCRSSSDSDSDEDEAVWVEKSDKNKQIAPNALVGPKLERDSWMTAPPEFFPSVSREELRAEKRKEKGEEENVKNMEEQIGQHERELNPYWKDGGTGLPEQDLSRKSTASSGPTAMAGDGGVGWWRKAYQRCVEQADEDGRPLEEIAAERYGSLQKLEDLVAAAEQSAKQRHQEKTRSIRERPSYIERNQRSRSREREATKRRSGGRQNSEERQRSWSRDSHGKRKRDDSIDREFGRSENRKHRRTRSQERDRHRSRSDSRERSKIVNRSGVRETSRHQSRSRSKSSSADRSNSSDRNISKRRRSRSNSRDRSRRRRSRSDSRRRHRSRSDSRDRSRRRRSRSRSRERTRRRSSRGDSRDSPDRRRSYGTEKTRQRNRSDSRERFRHRSDSRERSGSRRGTGNEISRSREQNDYRSRLAESKPLPTVKTSLLKMKFLKPTDDDDSSISASRSYRDKVTTYSGKTTPGWRKKTFLKPDDSNRENRARDKDEIPTKKHYKKSRESDSESSSSSSDSSRSSSRSPVRRDSRSRDASAKERSKKENKDSSSSGSSSSSSDDSEDEASEEDTVVMASPPRVLSDQEMNKLGADIVRAEIMGDTALVQTLTAKMDAARKAKAIPPASSTKKEVVARKTKDDKDADENVVVLTRTDKSGMVRPLPDRQHPVESKHGRRKKKKVKTHTSTGERERYFDDDDRRDLKTMVAEEKLGTAEDQNLMFARLAGRSFEKTDDEYQMDDVMLNRASTIQSQSRVEDRERHMAVLEHKKMSSAMEKCNFCFENVPKHLIIAIGIKKSQTRILNSETISLITYLTIQNHSISVYLCLPYHKSLTEGHCFIVPMQHVTQSTAIDEDVWHEIQVFRKGLTKMFEAMDEDCVFMETCMRLNKFPHMVMECIPMPKETGDMAPIYFKKAIMESGSEWDQNKKLVSLSEKNIRRAVPKGFPYFSVDFGLQGGFAHVIENEQTFPHYFGREIIGGMLDLEPGLWRKPGRENFETQRLKVLQFAEWWKPYDWTQKLKDDNN